MDQDLNTFYGGSVRDTESYVYCELCSENALECGCHDKRRPRNTQIEIGDSQEENININGSSRSSVSQSVGSSTDGFQTDTGTSEGFGSTSQNFSSQISRSVSRSGSKDTETTSVDSREKIPSVLKDNPRKIDKGYRVSAEEAKQIITDAYDYYRSNGHCLECSYIYSKCCCEYKPNNKFCDYCGKYGHVIFTCFKVNACKVCGNFGHNARSCREKKTTHVEKRGDKNGRLISESFQRESDRVFGDVMALEDKIQEYEDEKLDNLHDLKMESDEEKEAKAKKEAEDEKERLRCRRDDRFLKKVVNKVPTTIDSDFNMFDDGEPIFKLIPEDPKVPNNVPDVYDEDPLSYTFTSPIDWPDLKNLFLVFWECVNKPFLYFILAWMFVCFCVTTFFYIFIMMAFPLAIMFLSFVLFNLLFFNVGSVVLVYLVFRWIFQMVKWKNTYTFVCYLDADKVDLRTDPQMRSDVKHKDAVYARYIHRRTMIFCYSENYRHTGQFATFLLEFTRQALKIPAIANCVPYWLMDGQNELVISLEAFDQAKEFANVDFTSNDSVAGDKLKTAIKRISSVWINRSIKIDPLYSTTFVLWAYFKHMQQKTAELPFHRPPLNLT